MRTHTIEVRGEKRELPIVSVGDVSVALLNLLGDTLLTEAAAEELSLRLPHDIDTLITPEVKAVPLAHAISVRTGVPYRVVRKTVKPYMRNPVKSKVTTITTGGSQQLVIDGADIPSLHGKRVMIVDDVVSTGATLESVRNMLDDIGAIYSGMMVVFTEGNERLDVISLGHLPLYPNE